MCSSVTTGYYIVMLFPKLKCVYLCGSCDFCCLYYIIHVLLLVTIPNQFCDVSNNIENVELSASSLSPPHRADWRFKVLKINVGTIYLFERGQSQTWPEIHWNSDAILCSELSECCEMENWDLKHQGVWSFKSVCFGKFIMWLQASVPLIIPSDPLG